MIGQMATLIALVKFNDLGQSVIPIFLLKDHFLYQITMLNGKNEGNLSIRSFKMRSAGDSSNF